MENYLSVAIKDTQELFLSAKVDAGHGIGHSLIVMEHARKTLEHLPDLKETEKNSILLAALLHDADDKKFFGHKGYQNAEKILQKYPEESKLALEMISLVSCSQNGNVIPECPQWMLIPRWCDRLEAMGEIGIKRCEIYNSHVGRPKYLSTTPIVKSKEDLIEIATPERFLQYQNGKTSESMIDHFYDKLLHLKIPTGFSYIDNIMEERHEEMIRYVLKFWEEIL